MTEQEIGNYLRKLSRIERPVNKWIYRTTCEECKNYVDFKMSVNEKSEVYKYCTDMQCYITNPKSSCTVCDFNKANPSNWYKFKYKLKKLWNSKK